MEHNRRAAAVYVQLIEQLELALVAGASARQPYPARAGAGRRCGRQPQYHAACLARFGKSRPAAGPAHCRAYRHSQRYRIASSAPQTRRHPGPGFSAANACPGHDRNRGRDPAAGNRNIRKGVTQWNLYMKSTACEILWQKGRAGWRGFYRRAGQIGRPAGPKWQRQNDPY